jgi:hypothetical protein
VIFTSCGKVTDENVDDMEFCLYTNIENIDNTISHINDFLGGLSKNLNDDKKMQELTKWLKSHFCITNVTVFRTVWSSFVQRSITEILISFNENGISKEIILDVLMTNPLEARGYHPHYYPSSVRVTTKPNFTIDKVFDFINSFDHDVMCIENVWYKSTMSAENLIPIRDALRAKPYISGPYYVLHFLTNEPYFRFWLCGIKNKDYQADWFKTIEEYQLVEITDFGEYYIHFMVPEGTEKEWKAKFEEYDFVESVELSYWIHN